MFHALYDGREQFRELDPVERPYAFSRANFSTFLALCTQGGVGGGWLFMQRGRADEQLLPYTVSSCFRCGGVRCGLASGEPIPHNHDLYYYYYYY